MKKRFLELVKSRFFRDSATLQIAGMINQLSQLASTVFLAFLLGAEGQGQFVLAVALQGLLHFVIATGVVPATVAQIAAAHVRGNHDKTAGWIAFLAKAVLTFGTIVLAVGWFVLPWLGQAFYDEHGHGHQIGMWAWFLCLEPLLDLPRVVASVAFQGTRRMRALGQVENADEIVRFFLVVLGAAITGSPAGAIAGTVIAALFGSVLAIELYSTARHDDGPPLPGVRDILRRMPDVPLWKGLRLGIRVGLLKNGTALFLSIFPRLIIGKIVGEAWTSYFHIAQRVLTVPTMFMLGVSRTSLSALGELAGKKDWRGFRRLFTRVTLLTGGALSALILIGFPLVKPIASVLFTHDYVEPVFAYYRILALGYIPFTFAVAIESFYIATNHVRTWLVITVIGAIVTIPLNVWLILHVPYTGTAWGLSLYQSWVLVHLAWIFWALYSGRVTRWGKSAEGDGGSSGTGPKDGGPGDADVLAEAELDIAGRASGARE
jgi:O-antigen/teichoic acid export membrane protein